MKVQFSRTAIDDLKRLQAFVAEHNSKAAGKVAKRLRSTINHLRDFPLMGLSMKGLPSTHLRELIADDYIITYTFSEKLITIVQIWHGRERIHTRDS